MKAFPYDLEVLRDTRDAACKKNFGSDSAKMLEFMCRNVWKKAEEEGGQGYLAFGPYWWAVKAVIERVIGSQWGKTTAVNPVMRQMFTVPDRENSEALTLLLADAYWHMRLENYGATPHHDLEYDPADEGFEEEYTLEDSDMIRRMLS